jgi:hypothetical protein
MESMLRQVNNTLHDLLNGSAHFKDKKMHLPSIWGKKSNEFEATLRKATPDFFGSQFKAVLKQSMDEVQGSSLPNFMSTPVFRKALQTIYFDKSSASNPIDGILKLATHTIVSGVSETMVDAIHLLMDEHMSESPKLASFFKERVVEMTKERSSFVTEHVRVMLKAELVKPHTYNHYYADTIAKVKQQIQERVKDSSEASYEAIEHVPDTFLATAASSFKTGQSNFEQSISDMQISLFSYCKSMRKCIVDVVAKLVWSEMMYELDMKFTSNLKKSVLETPELLEKLMAEDRVTAHKREKLKLTIDRFSRCLCVLRSV